MNKQRAASSFFYKGNKEKFIRWILRLPEQQSEGEQLRLLYIIKEGDLAVWYEGARVKVFNETQKYINSK